MIEIITNLYIGSEADYEQNAKHQPGWYIIHACKEPYHRQALGYTKRGAPTDHPEYLLAEREGKLILNLVDVPNPNYIRKEIIDKAIEKIDENILNKKILVHCNQGMSRSATIGLLYMHHSGKITTSSFLDAEKEFVEIYPGYNPANGMREFARLHWDDYSH